MSVERQQIKLLVLIGGWASSLSVKKSWPLRYRPTATSLPSSYGPGEWAPETTCNLCFRRGKQGMFNALRSFENVHAPRVEGRGRELKHPGPNVPLPNTDLESFHGSVT